MWSGGWSAVDRRPTAVDGHRTEWHASTTRTWYPGWVARPSSQGWTSTPKVRRIRLTVRQHAQIFIGGWFILDFWIFGVFEFWIFGLFVLCLINDSFVVFWILEFVFDK